MTERAIQDAFRYCPQCGSENLQPGEIPFRCDQCGFSHFFGPVCAVGGLIVNDQRELLLVRRARDPGRGKWGLPGGFVDQGESVEDALRREIHEETNLQVASFQYLMSHPNRYTYHGVTSPVIDMFYQCRAALDQPLSLAQEELDSHQWVRPAERHLDQMAFHSNRVAIEHWLEKTNR